MVRLPDTAGQLKNVKDVPVRVLRGFFAGIGQLLLAAERFRAEEARREGPDQDEQDGPPTGLDGEHVPHQMTTADYVRSATAAPVSARTGTGTEGQAASPRQFRSLDSTGNVRVLTPEMPAESSADDDQPAARADLPVPGYDGLSLPSLRARLRNLDVTQVRTLLEHEKSAGNRADVVGMLERRIAKLEAAHDAP